MNQSPADSRVAPKKPGQSVPRWTALVAGGSGLVGSRLLEALAATADCGRVIAITRRPLVYDHPKLANRIAPFDKLADLIGATRADIAFCCLGTTLKAAGSKEAFRQVDFDYTVGFAQAALKAGVRRFVLNSSVSADPASKYLYLRVKGETEEAIAKLGFASLDILQPSLLLGVRKELRPTELVMMGILPLVAPLLLGKFERYRPVSASVLAAAMIGATRTARRGLYRYTWRGIHDLAGKRSSNRR
jgi:uncharacterized protein YbjT (DUF2867 family)